jgi:hypothetical protein
MQDSISPLPRMVSSSHIHILYRFVVNLNESRWVG